MPIISSKAGMSAQAYGLFGVTSTNPIGYAGYLAGGNTSGVSQTSIYKYNFTTDSVSTLSATLGLGRYQKNGLSNYQSVAYFLNGYISGGSGAGDPYSEKFTFSNETISTLSNTTVHAEAGSSTNSGTAGYQFGGYSNGDLNTSGKTTYSNDTTASTTNAAFTGRLMMNGNNKGVRGYYGGGTGGGSTIYYWLFSNDTTASLGQSFPTNSAGYYYMTGYSNDGTALYMNNGSSTPPNVNIGKMPFSTQTVSTLSALPTYQSSGSGNTSIGAYGLISNQVVNTQKISYVTDTLSAGTSFSAAKGEPFTADYNNY